jgi:hypothetical protein
MDFDGVLSRFDVKKRTGNGGAKARCPAHEDAVASLSIDPGRDGKTLLICFAGCDTQDVVAAAGLEMRDLFTGEAEADLPELVTRRSSATRYEIRDVAGALVAVHKRIDHGDGKKEFFWLQPNGKAGLNGTRAEDLPLYGSHRLAEWSDATPLVLAEGEKATEALWQAGIPAVGTVCGASVTPSASVLAPLSGRAVIAAPDNDAPGQRHMSGVAAALDDIAAVGWLVIPAMPPGGDFADYLATHTPDEARDLLASAGGWAPEGDHTTASENGAPGPSEAAPDKEPSIGSAESDSIMGRLGARVLTDIDPAAPPPMEVDRVDPEGHTILFGTGGVGKGAVAAAWIVQLVGAGHRVLIADYENHPGEWARRIASLGGVEVLASGVHVAPLTAEWGGTRGPLWKQAADLRTLALALDSTYLVLDSIVPACAGVDPSKPEAVSQYAAALELIGLPALSLAHVNRADDLRYPFGSVFWHNLARTTWSLQASADGAVLTHRKHNNYASRGKFLVTAAWEDNRLTGLWEKPWAAALGDLIDEVLGDDALTLSEIVDALNVERDDDEEKAKADSVSKALRRGVTTQPQRYAVEGTGAGARWRRL